MNSLVSNYLRHFPPLLCNRLTEFDETLQWASTRHPLPSSFVILRLIEKRKPTRPLIGQDIFTTLLPLIGIWWKLTGSKYSTFCTKFLFSKAYWTQRWLPWPLIGWNIFHFSCCSCWTKFDENLQECPLSLCFSGLSKNRWLHWPLIGWAIFYFTSASAKQNLTIMIESKNSTSSSKFVFFGHQRIISDWPSHFTINTPFLRIFVFMAFIVQKENDNNDNLCKISAECKSQHRLFYRDCHWYHFLFTRLRPQGQIFAKIVFAIE